MKKALLIIDIQNDYFENGKNPLEGALDASVKAKLILDSFRKEGNTVVHIQHIAVRPGSTFFLPETKGIEFHSNVMPLDGEAVFIKHSPNSFKDIGLLEYLRENEIGELVVCGMMTHFCVDTTVRAAKDLGFEITLIGDATATKDLAYRGEVVGAKHVQMSYLSALGNFFSVVTTAEEYLNK